MAFKIECIGVISQHKNEGFSFSEFSNI